MPKVWVPQETGEVLLAIGGDEPKQYRVSGHETQVAEEFLSRFLDTVPGSKLVDAKTASARKEG